MAISPHDPGKHQEMLPYVHTYRKQCSPHRHIATHPCVVLFLLCVLLLPAFINGWPAVSVVKAATIPVKGRSQQTVQNFLKQGSLNHAYHGPFIRPQRIPPVPGTKTQKAARKSLPRINGASPTMKPLSLQLSSGFLASHSQIKRAVIADPAPLDLKSSDGRLEVLVPHQAIDSSQAARDQGLAPVGAYTLLVSQISGHTIKSDHLLGTYQLQVLDSQGHVVHHLHLLKPLTIRYHYTSTEMFAVNLDPGQIQLRWPALIDTANKSHQSTHMLVASASNNAHTRTLTVQTSNLESAAFTLGGLASTASAGGSSSASMSGNDGQSNYSYPLSLPPGPAGFTPSLVLNYSSNTTNQRTNQRTPAGSTGEGWTLSLGSITFDGTVYTLNELGGKSERLIPSLTDQTRFETMNITHMRIVYSTDTKCFHVWDRSGTEYEFGCTADSLQYTTDFNGTKTNYRWDLDRMVAPFNFDTQVKLILISYLQDKVTTSGNTSIRDAGMKQIVYGTASSPHATTLSQVNGTVDFHYHAPQAQGSWAAAYGKNYHCVNSPPKSTTLRCDDELSGTDNTGFTWNPPTVMSTLTLDSITSYVGKDDSTGFLTYKDAFSYLDYPFTLNYTLSGGSGVPAAGDHLLASVIPTIYQNGQPIVHKGISFTYTKRLSDIYTSDYDTVYSTTDAQTRVSAWKYLATYFNQDTGSGGSITYRTAHANALGTPVVTDNQGNVIDDRLDPFYCDNQKNNSDSSKRCNGTEGNGNFANTDFDSTSVQVVTQLRALGTDSSGSALQPPTTTYNYSLAISTNTNCNPIPDPNNQLPPQEQDCVGDYWSPSGTGKEFRGFNIVYATSPAGNLTASYYYSAEGWGTDGFDALNYNEGQIYQQDVYAGNQVSDSALLSRTINTYTGFNGLANACNTQSGTAYPICNPLMISSRVTTYDGTGSANSAAPWVQTNSTYDDYDPSKGLVLTGAYHNLLSSTVYSSNAPKTTAKSSYVTTNQAAGVNNDIYYNVTAVSHRELDDSTGHVWDCQDTTYDENSSPDYPTVAAGWPTTQTAYSNCSNQSQTALKSYTGYDAYGNVVATVDSFGASNSNLYSNTGCKLSTPPAYIANAWTAGSYTGCTVYDSYNTQPVQTQNVLGQQTTTSYDYTQGGLPVSVTDANGQTATTTYSYDSNSQPIVQVKKPGETGTFTTQSSVNSTCTSSSTLPCYEEDAVSAQYPNAVSRTFYDSEGRAVETLTPGPDAQHDMVTFTVYNDANNSVFQSVPFRVASTTSWIDPNGATDDTGATPGGNTTVKDALGRDLASSDPQLGSATEPGVSCGSLSGTWTSCYSYGLGSVSGDNQVYAYAISLDANNHQLARFIDALGRTRYELWYSQAGSINSNVTAKRETRYNALNLPTAVIMTDLAPQPGQTITQVTASATYDDMGQQTSVSDPDAGNFTYTYDADGRVLTEASGTRTLGASYDLLGRVGCIQDAAPTTDGSGTCSSGSHPLLQNTYDTATLGTQGNTTFSIGQLTQSIATTYFPDGSAATVTQQGQYDQRGRTVAATMQIGTPSGWNVTNTLPTYQVNATYNDADQTMMTQTSVNGQVGYTFSQAYDSTTGQLTGLSNNATGVANLATLGFNANGGVSDVNFQSTSGSALANEHYTYDLDQRAINSTATWQAGSGSSGTIFSQSPTYDPAGNVISQTTTLAAVPGQSASGGSETQNFCYDEEDRLVWAGNSGTEPAAGNGTCGTATLASNLSGASYSTSYAYTHLGQLWQGPLNGSGAQQQYLYCDSTHPHQLTGLYPMGTTCASLTGASYNAAYDAWGNMTTRSTNGSSATLSYDQLDHFVQWSSGSVNNESYIYDSSGQRVLRRSTSSSGTTMTVYAFGLEEHVYDGTGVSQSNLYYYRLGGQLLGAYNGTTMQFFLTDAIGSVISTFTTVAGTAVIQGNQLYGPYGNSRYVKGSMGTNQGYTGQYNDALTGLDYYNSRYYDPTVGRFLSADNVQGDEQGVDPYDYVGGNPISSGDPSGHCPWCIVGAVVGAGVDIAVQLSQGQTLQTLDWGQVVYAGLAGAVIGGTLGLLPGLVAIGLGVDEAGAASAAAVASAAAIDATNEENAIVEESAAATEQVQLEAQNLQASEEQLQQQMQAEQDILNQEAEQTFQADLLAAQEEEAAAAAQQAQQAAEATQQAAAEAQQVAVATQQATEQQTEVAAEQQVGQESAISSGGGGNNPPATTEESVTRKLNDYLLNPDHPAGGPKANWFRLALGFTRDNANELASQITFDPSAAVEKGATQYGTKFNQAISIVGANGRTIDVVFAWIRNNDGVIRLVTAIPTK